MVAGAAASYRDRDFAPSPLTHFAIQRQRGEADQPPEGEYQHGQQQEMAGGVAKGFGMKRLMRRGGNIAPQLRKRAAKRSPYSRLTG